MTATTNALPAFRWNERYSVNIAALDLQHQGLFDTINELNVALSDGQGAAAMDRVLHKLVEYAEHHFSAEESLMKMHGFPGLATHRVEHEAFGRNIAKYLDDYKKGKPGAPVSLLLFLQSWLKEHILKTDKAYSSFLNEHGVH